MWLRYGTTSEVSTMIKETTGRRWSATRRLYKEKNKFKGKDSIDVAAIWNNIGVAYRNQGDYPKALECYEKAL
jgi:tetratricopeptide (TPR) repeat protein